jgi:disulfide bond formation protein DsbB
MSAKPRAVLNLLVTRWPWVALIVSVLMLAAANYFEHVRDLAPCILCLRQRVVYWVAGAIALVGIAGGFTPWRGLIFRLACLALAAAFAFGIYLAGWHVGAEQGWWPGPPACAGGATGVSAADILAGLNAAEPVAIPSCEDPVWWFLGITMAGWNLIISAGLFLFSLLAAWRGLAKRSPA